MLNARPGQLTGKLGVGKGVGSLFILVLSPTGVFLDAKEHSRLLFQDRCRRGCGLY